MSAGRVRGEQCPATSKRTGQRCRQWVRGGGPCRRHGGAAPQVAAKRLARLAVLQQAAVMPDRPPVSPTEALAEEVSRTVSLVRATEQLLAGGANDPALVAGFRKEREHLAKVAEAAVRTKVGEQLADRQERQRQLDAGLLRDVVAAVLGEFGHDVSSPEVLERVQRVLRRLDEQRSALTAGGGEP